MAELSLWLDSYDDIYSDFDSRHYVKRRVSEDFLHELRSSLKYKDERIKELILLLPASRRDEQNESVIIASLKEYFKDRFRSNESTCRIKLRRAIIFGLIGICFMFLSSYIAFRGFQSFVFVAIRVVLEPAGWFLVWVSLDSLVYDWKDLSKEKELYKELAELNIHFKSS